jgi:hypothetical protein
MTKPYELVDHSMKHLPEENFCGVALHLCLKMCVNMADRTQWGEWWLDNYIIHSF